MLSPVLLKACFACATPAIIRKLYLNRLHLMTGLYDGVIAPVIFEFTGFISIDVRHLPLRHCFHALRQVGDLFC